MTTREYHSGFISGYDTASKVSSMILQACEEQNGQLRELLRFELGWDNDRIGDEIRKLLERTT